MRVFRLFAVVALAVVLAGLPAKAATSCAALSIAELAELADVVVYGTVTEIRPAVAPEIGVVRFRVERVFKGTPLGEIEVAIGPSGDPIWSTDYVVTQRGSTHTLYLSSADNDPWKTDVCSGSHPGAPTSEETAYFGPGREPAVPGPGREIAVPGTGGGTASFGTRSSVSPRDDIPFVFGTFAVASIAFAAAFFARRATRGRRG